MYARLVPLLLCAAVLSGTAAVAQVTPPEIRQILPEKGIYRFPAFNEGEIVFRTGIVSSVRLNYNVSLNEMHFITDGGDTLSIADPPVINFITLNGSRFYYDNGFLQTIDTTTINGIILAFNQVLTPQQQKNIGVYDMTQPHEGLSSVIFFTGNGQIYKLGQNDKVVVTARENYFFGDKYGHFAKASKKYILLSFKENQPELKAFIKTNHVNFNTLKDLLKLMEFCRGLQ